MKKRSNRRLETENGNIGCMWGLIRMLHFRRDPKMLLDQREGSRQYFVSRYSKGIKSGDLEEIREEDGDGDQSYTKPTVKKLIEKEMARGKIGKRKIPSDEIDRILSDWGHEIQPDNKISKKRRPKPNSNPKSYTISNPDNIKLTENSDLEVVIASFLIEIYRYHNECQLCKNKSGLCPTLKSVVSSKLNDLSLVSEDGTTVGEKHLSNTGVSQSKKFMNALEILGSNKELFLKILQDPESHVLEKVQEIHEKRDVKRFTRRKEDEKSQEINEKRDIRRFYRREEEENKTSNPPSASKIVVLKPKATAKPSYDTKVVSHFSFREIKRRLKQIIGENVKERKDPYLFKVVNGMNKPQRQVHATLGSSFYEEAKKHLTEILRNGNESENSTSEHVSIPLGKMLSLTQSNLGLNLEQNVEKGYNAIESVILTKEGLESIASVKKQIQERGIQNDINSETHLEAFSEEMAGKGTVNAIEIKIEDTECISTVNVPLEDTTAVHTILSEASNEDPMPELTEQFRQSEEELIEESVTKVSDSLGNSIIEVPECRSPEPSTSYSCKENHIEKEDHPSPISVLESFFSDDVPSPDCKITDHDKLRKAQSPAWSNFTSLLEDATARSEFIESVLEYSGLCKGESLERWYLEEELLEPSSFDQLNIVPNDEDNSRLLFDCICEVLTEIQLRYFRFPQQAHARKRNLLNEVCHGVNWHLRNKNPFLLDHLIRSDLDHGNWCDLREETDGIVVEVWDELIDDLLEETVFDLWL